MSAPAKIQPEETDMLHETDRSKFSNPSEYSDHKTVSHVIDELERMLAEQAKFKGKGKQPEQRLGDLAKKAETDLTFLMARSDKDAVSQILLAGRLFEVCLSNDRYNEQQVNLRKLRRCLYSAIYHYMGEQLCHTPFFSPGEMWNDLGLSNLPPTQSGYYEPIKSNIPDRAVELYNEISTGYNYINRIDHLVGGDSTKDDSKRAMVHRQNMVDTISEQISFAHPSTPQGAMCLLSMAMSHIEDALEDIGPGSGSRSDDGCGHRNDRAETFRRCYFAALDFLATEDTLRSNLYRADLNPWLNDMLVEAKITDGTYKRR